MDDAVNGALIALAVRDVPRASPRQIAEWAAAARLTPRDRTVVEAAVALRSGWPDRARALLADVDGGLAAALRVAAPVVGRNRFPGGRGALFEEGDLAAFEDAPPTDGVETDEVLLMVAVGQVDAMVTNWRSLARDGGAEAARLVIDRARQLRAVLGGTAAPWLHGYLALVEADLHRLAGDVAAAAANWEQAVATCSSGGDGLGEAAAHLALGDWLVAPRTSPEALDLTIDLSPTVVTTPPDPAGARAAYDRAQSLYASVSCELGLAALALREGFLAAAAGDAVAWAGAAARCESMARRGGDDWLALLAGVHGALATIWSGDAADDAGLAGRAGALHAGGSRGWVRGLVRLVVAWSTVRRDAGEFVAARRSLRLARGIADASGAPRDGRRHRPTPRPLRPDQLPGTAGGPGAGHGRPVAARARRRRRSRVLVPPGRAGRLGDEHGHPGGRRSPRHGGRSDDGPGRGGGTAAARRDGGRAGRAVGVVGRASRRARPALPSSGCTSGRTPGRGRAAGVGGVGGGRSPG